MNFTERDITPNGMHVIQVGFFKARKSCFCCRVRRYEHVELRFSDGAVTSITRDPGVVHYHEGRVLSNPLYSCFFSLCVAPEAEHRVQRNAKSNQSPFSLTAMIWNFAPLTSRWPIEGTFCSSYVTRILQELGYVEHLDPRVTSPDVLFEALAEDDRTFASFNKRKEL